MNEETICSRPEQLGMDQFYDKILENFQQYFEHREVCILAYINSASKVGNTIYLTPHQTQGILYFSRFELWIKIGNTYVPLPLHWT